MSKSKKVRFDTTAADNYLKYLNNYDTSKVDNTISNMENTALNFSNQLGNMGNYSFSVDGSDAARQRAEAATYQSYLDKLTPQFDQQQKDLETRLQNQGLSVGSEAYQRAMNDFLDNKNEAINQAAYNAVNQGQSSFSQSLADAMSAGNYGNTAQQGYINLINSLLGNSVSGYDNQQNIYSVGMNKALGQYNAAVQNAKNKGGLLNGLISGGASLLGDSSGTDGSWLNSLLKGAGTVIGGYFGGPAGAAAGSAATSAITK